MDDPLLQLPNVVIAPHIASATVQTRNQMAEICARQPDRGPDGPETAGVGESGGGGETAEVSGINPIEDRDGGIKNQTTRTDI